MSTDSKDQPHVPIVCEQCDTTARVALSDLAETLTKHNERLHAGEELAVVDPDVADSLADLIATDMGLFDEPE